MDVANCEHQTLSMIGPTRRDTEAHCEKKVSQSLTGRLTAKFHEDAPDDVHGPVDEAVEQGAELHSIDAATFLADFHAIRFRRVARPDKMLEVVIRVPGKDPILACMDCQNTIATVDG